MIKVNPYFVISKTIYYTDRVEEIIIYNAEQDDLADKICTLLNEAYNAAYQDGLVAAEDEKIKEINRELMALTIENYRLKKQLNIK